MCLAPLLSAVSWHEGGMPWMQGRWLSVVAWKRLRMLQGVRWFSPCWNMANADEAQELLWGAGHVGGGL